MKRVSQFAVPTVLMLAACTGGQPPTLSPTGPPTSTPSAQPSPSPSPTSATAGRTFTQTDFTKSGGCGNVYMWATTEDETFAVTMQWNVGEPGEAQEFEQTAMLPDAEVIVTLQTGAMLTQGFCTDIMGMPGHRIDGEAQAVAGTVKLRLDPNDDGQAFQTSLADLTLDGIVFDITFGSEVEQWRIDQFEVEDVLVGWLAG